MRYPILAIRYMYNSFGRSESKAKRTKCQMFCSLLVANMQLSLATSVSLPMFVSLYICILEADKSSARLQCQSEIREREGLSFSVNINEFWC